jgi:hypothetical protein
MSDGRIHYPCATCHHQYCQCDRTAARNRSLTLLTFPCPQCPMEIFYCVNDLYAHIELRHSRTLLPAVSTMNGANP